MRFEEMALDVKAGMEFLRRQPGITKIPGGQRGLVAYVASCLAGMCRRCQNGAWFQRCSAE